MTLQKGLSEEDIIRIRRELMEEREQLQERITLLTNRLKCRRSYHRNKDKKKGLKISHT